MTTLYDHAIDDEWADEIARAEKLTRLVLDSPPAGSSVATTDVYGDLPTGRDLRGMTVHDSIDAYLLHEQATNSEMEF